MSYSTTLFSAFLCRTSVALVKLVTIPLLFRALGTQDYACFIILSSLEGWSLLLDFGLGSVMQHMLPIHYTEHSDATPLLRGTLYLSMLGFFITLCLWMLLLPFTSKLCSDSLASHHLCLFGIFYLLQAQASIATKVLIARKQGHLSYYMQTVSALVSLGCLLLFPLTLTCVLYYTLGIQTLFVVALACYTFRHLSLQGPRSYAALLRALPLFAFNIIASCVTLFDSLLMAFVLSAEEIISYNLLCKIFGILSFLYAAALQRFSSSSWQKLEANKYRFCLYSITGIVCCSLLLILGRPIISLYFSISLLPSCMMLFCLYLIIRVVCDLHAMILQRRQHMKPLFIFGSIQALLSITLQLLFGRLAGAQGLLVGQSLSYVSTVLWALPRYTKEPAS